MGFLDRFKKRNTEVAEQPEILGEEEVKQEEETPVVPKEEEKVQEPKEEKQAPQLQGKQSEPKDAEVANEGRRFTLLVENAKQLTEEEGIMIAGMLYGNVQLGDEVYMLLPNHTVRMSTIDGIEVAAGQNADKAENQKVVLQFKEIKDINQVPRYTVITSIRPQDKPTMDTGVENPHLLGLSMDYPRLNRDPLYMNLLVFELCHAFFLVPARVAATPELNSEGRTTFQQNTQVRFPGLQDPMNKEKSVFTIFTDWRALSNWKNLFDEKNPPKAIIMRFPDVVNVAAGNSVILNPYGPTSVYLPAEMIQQITSLEGYQQEFGNN